MPTTLDQSSSLERYGHNLTALARRQIQLIGACTLEQHRRYIERDAALQIRFQEIVLPSDVSRETSLLS